MLCALVLAIAGACPAGVFCNTTGPQTTATLNSAALISPTDAWVVGEWGTALHWNGKNWQPSPTGSTDTFHDVVAPGPKDVWVRGTSSLLHFDGTWHAVLAPGPRAQALPGTLVQPRPGVLWALGPEPWVIESGKVAPLTGPATALNEDGPVFSAAACAPDRVWTLSSTEGEGISLHFWDGTIVRTFRQPFRVKLGPVVCVKNVAWVSTDDSLLACTASTGCVPVAAPPSPRLVHSSFGPLVISEDRLFIRRDDRFVELGKVATAHGGVATSPNRVLLYGTGGSLSWFSGATAPLPTTVTLGRLTSVAALADGRAWAASETGLVVWNGSKWAQDPTFPGKRYPIEVASRGSEVWATAEGHAYRLVNRTWQPMTDSSVKVRDLFIRDQNDVYASGSETLHRWNGTTWTEAAKVKPGFSWTAITGTATTVYALAQGPRPEEGDGRSTGKPDAILVLENGAAPRWLEPRYRPDQLAIVGSELWSVESGHVDRLAGGKWVRVEGASFSASAIVTTEKGAVVLSQSNRAMEWDGERFTSLELPGEPRAGVSAGAVVWLVGDETALRRSP